MRVLTVGWICSLVGFATSDDGFACGAMESAMHCAYSSGAVFSAQLPPWPSTVEDAAEGCSA